MLTADKFKRQYRSKFYGSMARSQSDYSCIGSDDGRGCTRLISCLGYDTRSTGEWDGDAVESEAERVRSQGPWWKAILIHPFVDGRISMCEVRCLCEAWHSEVGDLGIGWDWMREVIQL